MLAAFLQHLPFMVAYWVKLAARRSLGRLPLLAPLRRSPGLDLAPSEHGFGSVPVGLRRLIRSLLRHLGGVSLEYAALDKGLQLVELNDAVVVAVELVEELLWAGVKRKKTQ
jgi:hypothetical protein